MSKCPTRNRRRFPWISVFLLLFHLFRLQKHPPMSYWFFQYCVPPASTQAWTWNTHRTGVFSTYASISTSRLLRHLQSYWFLSQSTVPLQVPQPIQRNTTFQNFCNNIISDASIFLTNWCSTLTSTCWNQVIFLEYLITIDFNSRIMSGCRKCWHQR